MPPSEPRGEFLYPGKNGMETSVAILEVLSGFSPTTRPWRLTMEVEKVMEIFRRLNEAGVRYAIIGGLAYAEYAPPRATQDTDMIVTVEDASRVRDLFPGCYLRGTAIAGIYELEGTRFDVLPARRAVQLEVLRNAVDSSFHGVPVKVATGRDFVFLKLWASCERRDPRKATQDRLDAGFVLEYAEEKILSEGIAWIACQLLALAYTPEEKAKLREAAAWMNRA
ncbi:MAG: hypothetical protein HY721_21920 [Planctomycetes bacterium]|nr:hypothetical protein [Planctomycetota bacterium]